MTGSGRERLAQRQADFVAALVTAGPPPPGVNTARLHAATEALLRKRAGEVARRWPALLETPADRAAFVEWARGRARGGSLRDGWDFADHRAALGELGPAAAAELRRARQRYRRDRHGTITPRRVRPFLVGRHRGRWAFGRDATTRS